MKTVIAIAALLGLAGCAYPTSTIQQATQPGRIRVAEAPLGASVEVDGQVIGYRTKERADVFEVAPGRHLVRLISGGRTLANEQYFIGTGSTVDIKAKQQ